MSYNEYDREGESEGRHRGGGHHGGREHERDTEHQSEYRGGKKHHGDDYEEGNIETGGYDRRSGLQSRDEYQPASRDEYTGEGAHPGRREEGGGGFGSRGRFSGGAGNTYTEYRSPERGEEKPNADLYGGESGTYGQGETRTSHHKPSGGGGATTESYDGGSTRGNYGGGGPTYNSSTNQGSHSYDGGSTRGNYGGQGPTYTSSDNQGSHDYDGGSSRGNYDGQGPSYNQSTSGKSSSGEAYVQGSSDKWQPGQKMSFPAAEAESEKNPFNDSAIEAAGETQGMAKDGLKQLENWAKNEVKGYLSGEKRG